MVLVGMLRRGPPRGAGTPGHRHEPFPLRLETALQSCLAPCEPPLEDVPDGFGAIGTRQRDLQRWGQCARGSARAPGAVRAPGGGGHIPPAPLPCTHGGWHSLKNPTAGCVTTGCTTSGCSTTSCHDPGRSGEVGSDGTKGKAQGLLERKKKTHTHTNKTQTLLAICSKRIYSNQINSREQWGRAGRGLGSGAPDGAGE